MVRVIPQATPSSRFISRRCDRVDGFPGRLYTSLVRFYAKIILFFLLFCHANNFVVDFVTLLRPPLVVGRKTTPSYCSTNIHVPYSLPPFFFLFFFFPILLSTRLSLLYTENSHEHKCLFFFCGGEMPRVSD